MKNILITVLIFTGLSFGQTRLNSKFFSEIDSSLSRLIKMQSKVSFIHPALMNFYPVAIIQNDSLYIFDYNKKELKYKFIKQSPVPFPMSEDMQASFPLSVYDNIPTCVTGKKIFNYINGYTIIMHEFVHCWQAAEVEMEIKSKLKIAQIAMANKDYMWELNHPFPYDDSLFVIHYQNFIVALNDKNLDEARAQRKLLKEYLSDADYEYMVWEEWKEGVARYVENKVKNYFLLTSNNYGKNQPYDRILFYYGGELWSGALIEKDKTLLNDPLRLYQLMTN
jgi:hypothetical protein